MSDTDDESTTYRDAGVDLEAADAAVDSYRDAVESTRTAGVLDEIGGFGGLFSLADAGIVDAPDETILVGSTDGVGTKLRVAFRTGRHDTIGIDCVAMCVNDVITTGAHPLFFLDYLSTGTLDPGEAEQVVQGIAEGCRRAGCALLGGETAEMPGFYSEGEYDIAGFCVGAVAREQLVGPERVEPGDEILGLASNGVHSNGFSLVRKVLRDHQVDFDETVDRVDPDRPIGEVLLEPTLLYTEPVDLLRDEFDVHGLAHVTGGGLPGNVPRALPDDLEADIDRNAWEAPPIFNYLRELGSIPEEECYRVFNMGIGFVAILPGSEADAARDALADTGWRAEVIGSIRRA